MAVVIVAHLAPHSRQGSCFFSPSYSSSSSSSLVHRIVHSRYPVLHFPYCNKSFFLRDRKHSKLTCRDSSGWDWNQWTRHFSDMEQAENYASILKFELEDAVEKQDFHKAAKLKRAIAGATSKDAIAKIMLELKDAILEERYRDASRLCRSTGSGLVGWWVSCSKDSDDPFGRLVHITPGMGRFIARSYTPRQLVNASPGTPLFELYVVKEANGSYNIQAVFLKRTKTVKPNSFSSNSKPASSSTVEPEDASVIDVKVNEDEIENSKEKHVGFEEAAEEGIQSVINFLKDRIPDLKAKVTKLNTTEEVLDDSDSLRQIIEEDGENSNDVNNGIISRDFSDEEFGGSSETSYIEDNHHHQIPVGGESTTSEDKKSPDMKLFFGVLHDNEDDPSKDKFIRVQAEIEGLTRDSFEFHIPKTYRDLQSVENSVSAVGLEAIAALSVSKLMPPDVAKAFLSVENIPPKIQKNMREILQLVSQVKNQNRLSEYTQFTRIATPCSDLDPFDGLYVGAFGPYATEIVQMKRKYGNWNAQDENKSSDMEFFEYVEAIKLTGDINVPAGEVTFRGKIGKGNGSTNKGMYPDELGVVASYKGQGRIAGYGFKNPKWVEGELLQLNGKGFGAHIKGADLGFLYAIPEHSFLVLFSRLKLPE